MINFSVEILPLRIEIGSRYFAV